MSRISEINPDESPQHRFGYELRKFRLELGLTQRQLADRLPCSETLLSRLESARRRPQRHHAVRLDEILPSPADHFLDLYKEMTWDHAPEHFRDWATEEQTATGLLIWSSNLIWGPLQTERYAHAVFSAQPGITPEQIDTRMANRMRRKAILTRDRPPMIICLIDEGALRRPIGGPIVMREQLAYLLEMAKNPNVTVQIVPYGSPHAPIGLMGEFHIGEMHGVRYIAWTEAQPQGSTTTERSLISRLSTRYDALRTDAHNRQLSIKMLEEVMCEWAGQT